MAFVTNWKDDAGLTRNVFQEDQQNAFVHRGPRIYSDIGVVVGELDPRPQHHDTRREHFGGVKISAEELAERSRIPVTTEERWTAFLESILSDLVFAPKQILTFLFPPPKPKLKYRSLEEHRKEGLREKAEQDLGSWYNSVMNKAEAHAIVAEYDEAVRLMNDKGYEDLPLPEELPKPGAPWNKWDEYEPETTVAIRPPAPLKPVLADPWRGRPTALLLGLIVFLALYLLPAPYSPTCWTCEV
ncbi:hypothetical protein CYMTET_55381 [Cymbomonas tetramitiformis]|uniref:Uncharacterized protein n=1 Tax=Cymbomonas tetramitiformis TaxID=36881 RepID=A0AAE0BEA2_9CHLO|nr:hypothetical protein CYMTET_55381 [Cymbomonas tetramitiformis]